MAKRIRPGDYIQFLKDTVGYGAYNYVDLPTGCIVKVIRSNLKEKQLFISIDNHIFLVRINNTKHIKIIPKSELSDLLYYE